MSASINPGDETAVLPPEGLREIARKSLVEFDAARISLQAATERANREFRFVPDPALAERIRKLDSSEPAKLSRLQAEATLRANSIAYPKTKFWHREFDAYMAKHHSRADPELMALRERSRADAERDREIFVAERTRDASIRISAERARHQQACDAVIARFTSIIRVDYLSSDESRFADSSDIELRSALQARRREFVRSWLHDRLGGLKVDNDQADAVGAVGSHVKLTARAGSGKTRTLTARAAFLVGHCGVGPHELLLLAFNRKAAREMAARLESFGIACPQVMTFHGFAHAIVRPEERLLTDDEGNPGKPGLITQLIRKWVETDLGDHRVRDVMMRFFRTDWEKIMFGGIVLDRARALDRIRRAVSHETLDGKQVKSFGEKLIANFLFENGVRYRYEPVHRWDKNVYRPDFELNGHQIVIEYFGMSSNPEYQKQMQEKRLYWQSKNWVMLEYDPAKMAGELADALPVALERDLRSAGVSLCRLSIDELWEARGKQLRLALSDLLGQLIGRCRKACLSPAQFAKLVANHQPLDPIEIEVLEIASDAYLAYMSLLEKDKLEDFDGLMQRAVAMVNGGALEFGRRDLAGNIRALRFVLVDEFQDVAPLFWGLLEAVRKSSGRAVEVFGVGDDWQAINGFAGSESKFLLEFGSMLQPSSEMGLMTNYRSAESVVTVGNAIMAGEGEPARTAPRARTGRVLMADLDQFTPHHLESHHWTLDSITPALRRLIAAPILEGKSVAVLARQRFVPYRIADRTLGSFAGLSSPAADIHRLRQLVCEGLKSSESDRVMFDTVHAFKGREADFVVILDAIDGRFPKVHPNWIFGRIFGDTTESLIEAERRLFYVGCSRAAETLVVCTESSRYCSFLEDVESHFDPIEWSSLGPACPRDGDWVMVLDSAPGIDSAPTMARRTALKAAEFSYSSSAGVAVWQRRVTGIRDVRGWAKEIPSRSWFDGPPGLRIRFLHGDGVLAGEYRVDHAAEGQEMALHEVWVES
jgi:DNA helicase-4